MNDDANEINAVNYRIDNSKTVTRESFEYKSNIIGSTPADKKTKKCWGRGVNFASLSFF